MRNILWRTLWCVAGLGALAAHGAEPLEATVPSSKDGAAQRVRYYLPAADKPTPLLVVLHTWSGNVDQKGFIEPCLKECERRGWALLHPDFRGPNVRPEACASDLVVQDVLDAVAWIEQKAKIDPRRRYLVGTSGGGHLTLFLAGKHPELWAGASAWVPISDLAAWHAESVARKQRYADDLERVCGGKPGDSATVDEEYRRRSPQTHLSRAKGLAVDINAGITDGHNGSVPVSHSLRAFNLLAEVNGQPGVRFTDAEIEALTVRQDVPQRDRDASPQETGRQHPVLVRRVAGPARVTIFQGGHEGDMPTAVRWLADQVRP